MFFMFNCNYLVLKLFVLTWVHLKLFSCKKMYYNIDKITGLFD